MKKPSGGQVLVRKQLVGSLQIVKQLGAEGAGELGTLPREI